MSNSCKLTV